MIDTSGISFNDRGDTAGAVTTAGHSLQVTLRREDGFLVLVCSCGFAEQGFGTALDEFDGIHNELFVAALAKTSELLRKASRKQSGIDID